MVSTGTAPEGESGSYQLPRRSRIHRGGEIRSLFRRGKRRRTAHLDVFFAVSPASHPRWAVVVPRHRHRIHERNLLKRRLREIGRTVVLPCLRRCGTDLDVLVRARREAYRASFQELCHELERTVAALCSGRSSHS